MSQAETKQFFSTKPITYIFLMVLGLTCTLIKADEVEDISKLLEQHQTTVALSRVNTLIAKNPQNPQALFLKGVILVEAGKRDDAIKTFNNLTLKYPNLPEPYNNLAVLYAETGQYDKAKNALETAIKNQPNYAAAHENLGDLYTHMASESYDRALQLDSTNTRAQTKLAMIKDLFEGGKSTSVAKVNESNKTQKTESNNNTNAKKETLNTTEVADSAKPKDPESNKVIEVVNRWANAWASKDADKYLASYTDSFKPPTGESRKDWEISRRERIKKPTNITSEIINQKVNFETATKATISFNQIYRTDGKLMYRTDGEPVISSKTLGLKRTNGNWLIDQESTTN